MVAPPPVVWRAVGVAQLGHGLQPQHAGPQQLVLALLLLRQARPGVGVSKHGHAGTVPMLGLVAPWAPSAKAALVPMAQW